MDNHIVFQSVTITIPSTENKLVIKTSGLPISQEALFLLDFLFQNVKKCHTALDMGCGTGLMGLSLASLYSQSQIIGMDIQKKLIDVAQQNQITNKINNIQFKTGDINDPDQLPPQYSQDIVIANPPFRKLHTGMISPDTTKSIACHEKSSTLQDFIYAASLVLKSKGILAIVILPERLPEITRYLMERHLSPYYIQFIHHRNDYPANAVLILARKDSRCNLEVASPRFVNNS